MPSVVPRIQAALGTTIGFLLDPELGRLPDDPSAASFALGSPQELPLAELVSAFQGALVRVGAASGAGSSRSLYR